VFVENTRKIKISASQLISNMICMNYDHNRKFGLLKFHSGNEKFHLNSPKGYSLKIINVQTASKPCQLVLKKSLLPDKKQLLDHFNGDSRSHSMMN